MRGTPASTPFPAGPGARQEARERLTRIKRVLLGFRSLLDLDLQPAGITTSQLRLLLAIKHTPGISGAGLARLCSVTPQTGQALLIRAERKGWILRQQSPGNGRVLVATLTPAGDDLLRQTEVLIGRLDRKLWRGATNDQLATLDALLALGCSNIERLQRQHP